MPPLSAWLRITPSGKQGSRIWLPLFLLWLILLPVVLFVFALAVVVDVLLLVAGQSYHHYSVLLVRCLEVVGDTRGMVVNVFGDDTTVDLTIN